MVLEEPPVVTPLAVLHPHVCPCRLSRQGFAFQSATARGLVWRTDCQGHHAVGSDAVSARSLPKTGIFQTSAGDYRRFRPKIVQTGRLATELIFAKTRNWLAFIGFSREQSPVAGLAGWRRSADRTRLRTNSLLTGNFTGNFAIPRVYFLARDRCAAVAFDAIPYAN
jgi:hypothetical protein